MIYRRYTGCRVVYSLTFLAPRHCTPFPPRRLERNRESARQSRRRKKQYLELLEVRALALRREMARLRTDHIAVVEAELAAQRTMLLTALFPLARKGHRTPEEEATLIDGAAQLLDRYGPNCSERMAVREFRFAQLMRLVLPPETKFLLWVAHQPTDFFSSGPQPVPPVAVVTAAGPLSSSSSSLSLARSASSVALAPSLSLARSASSLALDAVLQQQQQQTVPTAGAMPPPPPQSQGAPAAANANLWSYLCTELGITAEQADRLRTGFRRILGSADVARETWRLEIAAEYLERLRRSSDAEAQAAQEQLERIRDTLTPAQFIIWASWSEAHAARMGGGPSQAPAAAPASSSKLQ